MKVVWTSQISKNFKCQISNIGLNRILSIILMLNWEKLLNVLITMWLENFLSQSIILGILFVVIFEIRCLK